MQFESKTVLFFFWGGGRNEFLSEISFVYHYRLRSVKQLQVVMFIISEARLLPLKGVQLVLS